VADRKGARDEDRSTGADPHRRAARRSRAQRGADGAGPRTNSRGARAGHRTDAVSVAPDYAGPLIGWRTWAAVEEAGGLMLRSVVYDSRWPARERLGAICGHRPSRLLGRLLRVEPHTAPNERCECGIYAARTPDLALPYLGALGVIHGARSALIGRVALWGEVIECELGWRGAFAYPTHLYLLRARLSRSGRSGRDVARRLAVYGVPVEVVEAPTMAALLSALVTEKGVLSSAA